MNRRGFLRVASLGTIAGGSLLAACAPAPNVPTTNPASLAQGAPPTVASAGARPGKVQLPTYVPIQGPTPDIAAADPVPAAYTTFPKNLFKAVPNPPGKGGEVVVQTESSYPVVPLEDNPMWQQLNKELGVNLKLNVAPFADYAFGKFQAIVAGNDLPDMMYVPIGGAIPELGAFLEAKCQDVTPFVSGDAVKDYPNLANLPTIAWKGVVYNGKMFGVPVTSSLFYWGMWHMSEMLSAVGAQAGPTSVDDFKRIMLAVTRPQQNIYGIGFEVGNRYAFGLTNTGGAFWPALFGAPNNWALDNGKFTKDWETEPYKAAVGLGREMWAAGVFDPNTTYTTTTADTAFRGNKFAFRFSNALQALNFEAGARLSPPFAVQGVKPLYNYGIGNFGFTILKKASSERIKELLGILNYFASPFGSQEQLLLNYGVKDVEFTYDANGHPFLTPKGDIDTGPKGLPWGFFMVAPRVLYYAKVPEFGPTMHKAASALVPGGIYDPTIGLYSVTNQRQGVAIGQKLADGLIDIIAGRRPLSDFDQLVKEWRSTGGDTIRGELEAAYAASQ